MARDGEEEVPGNGRDQTQLIKKARPNSDIFHCEYSYRMLYIKFNIDSFGRNMTAGLILLLSLANAILFTWSYGSAPSRQGEA